MAVVSSNKVKYNVVGCLRQNIHSVTGVTTNTFVSGLLGIKQIIFDPGVITAVAAVPGPNSTNTITITSSGAFTNANIQLLGW